MVNKETCKINPEFKDELKKFLEDINNTTWIDNGNFASTISDTLNNIDNISNESPIGYATIKKLKEEKKKRNLSNLITSKNGIYIVFKEKNFKFDKNLNGLKNKKCRYNEQELKNCISRNSQILYIGKAEGKDGLKGRINQYLQTGIKLETKDDEENLSHRGGRAIWQINSKDRDENLSFFWAEFDDNNDKEHLASILESLLIVCYQFHNKGKYPFANRRN